MLVFVRGDLCRCILGPCKPWQACVQHHHKNCCFTLAKRALPNRATCLSWLLKNIILWNVHFASAKQPFLLQTCKTANRNAHFPSAKYTFCNKTYVRTWMMSASRHFTAKVVWNKIACWMFVLLHARVLNVLRSYTLWLNWAGLIINSIWSNIQDPNKIHLTYTSDAAMQNQSK